MGAMLSISRRGILIRHEPGIPANHFSLPSLWMNQILRAR
jgi:hypothetical protein